MMLFIFVYEVKYSCFIDLYLSGKIQENLEEISGRATEDPQTQSPQERRCNSFVGIIWL